MNTDSLSKRCNTPLCEELIDAAVKHFSAVPQKCKAVKRKTRPSGRVLRLTC